MLISYASNANALMRQFSPSPLASDTPVHIAIEDDVKTLLSEGYDPHYSLCYSSRGSFSHLGFRRLESLGVGLGSNMCLCQCESLLMPHLVAIFFASLQLHFLPHQWLCANVSAIPKPGGELSLPKGFHHISLL